MTILQQYDQRFGTQYQAFVNDGRNHFSRNTYPVHFTASVFPLSGDCSQCLLVHHRTLGKWLQPGGHMDDGETFQFAARRECLEETGLEPHITAGTQPISIDLHRIPENLRKGEPEHYHLDIRFAAYVTGQIKANLSEVHAAQWFPVDALDAIDERIRPRLKDFVF